MSQGANNGRADETAPRAELLQLLKDKALRRGSIVLASGKVSDFYLDCRQVSLHARGHVLVGKLFFSLIRRVWPRAVGVGGPTLGADPLVSAVSLTSSLEGHPLHGFLVRKEPKGHGTGNYLEGLGNLPPGSPVVLLEDVVTTGGSVMRTADRVREAGLDVCGLAVLVDRQEGGREAVEKSGLHLEALFTRSDFD